MTRLILTAAIGLSLTAGHTLSTDYDREHSLRIESVTTMKMETTSFEMEVDGESREGRGGDRSSEETRKVVQIDEVLVHEDGRPTQVRRTFEHVAIESVMRFGENETNGDRDGSLHEVTLELSLDDDGEVEAQVVEGNEPENEGALSGHVLTLALDAFLPDDEVEVDDSWDLESDAILHGLGADLSKALFPPAPREERPEGERGRGRGGSRGGGGGSPAAMFTQGEWEGTAKLASESTDHEGEICALIELELECSGDMPEPEGGGGRRRDFMPAATSGAPALESTFEIELEGRLYYSLEKKRPVALEIEGTLMTERNIERSFGEREMTMSTTQDGTFDYAVTITEESE